MKIDEYISELKGKEIIFMCPSQSERYFIELLIKEGLSVSETNIVDDVRDNMMFICPSKMSSELYLKTEDKIKDSMVTSELEAFLKVCPGKVIGVTGSYGKTFTSTLIAQLLRKAGKRVYTRESMEKSLFDKIDEIMEDDFVVLEITYLDLAYVKNSPNIAVITNIYSYPMDRFITLEQYITNIENIFKYQTDKDRAIANYDNFITLNCLATARSEAYGFSTRREQKVGVFLKDNAVIYKENDNETFLFSIKDLILPGKINLSYYMAAVAAVQGFVKNTEIEKYLADYLGPKNHFEYIREIDKVRYYNAAISETPAQSVATIQAFQEDIILITGGDGSEYEFKAFGMEIVAFVKKLILLGNSARKIRHAVESAAHYDLSRIQIFEAENLLEAVLIIKDIAKQGDCVLLSPACVKFGGFENHYYCGEEFKRIVQDL